MPAVGGSFDPNKGLDRGKQIIITEEKTSPTLFTGKVYFLEWVVE